MRVSGSPAALIPSTVSGSASATLWANSFSVVGLASFPTRPIPPITPPLMVTQSKAGSSYGWARAIASIMSSSRFGRATNSTLTSVAYSILPTLPNAGWEPSSGKNWPVPSASKLQWEYWPILPAPTANTASFTSSTWSTGIITPHLCSVALMGLSGFVSVTPKRSAKISLTPP